MKKLVTILFSDNTWYNCYEDEIEHWAKIHKWKPGCYKTARILYEDINNLRCINLEE